MPRSCFIAITRAPAHGALLFLSLLFGPMVMAATPGPNYAPGQIERQLDDTRHAKPPPAEEAVSIQRTTDNRAADDQPSFILSAVLIEGVSVYKTVDFVPLYQQLLGTPVTYESLVDLADAITRFYRRDGYLLAHAFIPKQHISHGVIRIRIQEGYVLAVDTGQTIQTGSPVREQLQFLQNQRPLTRDGFQRVVMALRALPDIDIRPQFSEAPDEPGAFILHLNMRQKHVDGVITVDNRGSELVGPVKAIMNLRTFNLTGQHEVYQAKLATTADANELQYAELSTVWPLPLTGLTLHVSGFRTTSRPGGSLEDYDVYVDNRGLTLGLSYMLIASFDRQLTLTGDLAQYQSRTDVKNVPYLEDRLDHFTLALADIRKLDSGALASYSIGMTHGLDLDNTFTRNYVSPDQNAETDFAKIDLDGYYQRNIFSGRALSISASAQYALDKLPNSQRFSVGGSRFSNANDPSEISGDHGLGLRIELAGKPHETLSRLSARLFAYYGVGATWNINDNKVDECESAASLGTGMRFSSAAVSGFIEAGKPLTRAVAEQGADYKDTRVFAGMTLRF